MSLLDLTAFRASPLTRDPFDYLILPGFVRREYLPAINAAFPTIDDAGSFPLGGLRYGPAFAALMEELRGDAVRAAFEEKFGLKLKGRPVMITVRGRCGDKDGNIHTDAVTKLITVLLYLNPTWEASGGRLRLLRSGDNLDDVIAEVPPAEGTLLTFRRSDNSWHGHQRYLGERRVIQLNWVTSAWVERRERLRHTLSAALKRVFGGTPESGEYRAAS
jgi:SM-20-related protein